MSILHGRSLNELHTLLLLHVLVLIVIAIPASTTYWPARRVLSRLRWYINHKRKVENSHTSRPPGVIMYLFIYFATNSQIFKEYYWRKASEIFFFNLINWIFRLFSPEHWRTVRMMCCDGRVIGVAVHLSVHLLLIHGRRVGVSLRRRAGTCMGKIRIYMIEK